MEELKMFRYIGKTDPLNVIHGKEYACRGSLSHGTLLSIIDESKEPCGYLYSCDLFEAVDAGEKKDE